MNGIPAALVIVSMIWFSAIIRILRMRRNRFLFRGGWLLVREGVIFQTETPYELTHLIEVKLTRGPLDRLTGNGKLHLHFDKHLPVVLHGVAPIDTLRDVQSKLIQVSRLLRSNPALKGIVA